MPLRFTGFGGDGTGCGCCGPTTPTGHTCGGCTGIPDSLTLSGPACELPVALTLTWSTSGPPGSGMGSGWYGREGGGTGPGIWWGFGCVTTPTLTIMDTTGGGFPPCSSTGSISSCSPFSVSFSFVIVPVGGGFNCALLGFDCGVGTFIFTVSA